MDAPLPLMNSPKGWNGGNSTEGDGRESATEDSQTFDLGEAEEEFDIGHINDLDEFFSQQPCEMIVQVLPKYCIPELRQLMGEGLSIDEFVEILGAHCIRVHPELQSRLETLEDILRKLFAEIDVNNNGDVDWEEFSHHVIHTTQVGDRIGATALTQDPRTQLELFSVAEVPTRRVRSSKFSFLEPWGHYCLVETIQGAVDTGRLTLFCRPAPVVKTPDYEELGLKLHAVKESNFAIDAVALVPSMNSLAVTTVNGKLQYYKLSTDPLLEERGEPQHLDLLREQHLVGRNPVLTYDRESNALFAGSATGELTVIDPTETLCAMPKLIHSKQLHTQSIIDIITMPSRGSKKIISAGLDAKMKLYDVSRGEDLTTFGESDGAVTAMSYSEEYSLLVTCNGGQLDPFVWAPHAVNNPFVKRLEDLTSKRSRLVGCQCVEQSPYCVTADLSGLLKLWDLRKMTMAVSVLCQSPSTATAKRVWCKNFAVDPAKFEIVSSCHTESGNFMFSFHPGVSAGRNPAETHDHQVISVCYVEPLDWFFTASDEAVKVWEGKTGKVYQHMQEFWTEEEDQEEVGVNRTISAMTTDPHGRRFYLGTYEGTVSMHSTATAGQLASFPMHSKQVTQLCLMSQRGVLISGSADNMVHVNAVEADPPCNLFSIKLDSAVPCSSLSTNEYISLLVVGNVHCTQFDFDLAPGVTKPVVIGRVPAYVDPTSQIQITSQPGGDADVALYVNPSKYEASCTMLLGNYPAAVMGDTRGFIQLVAVRPHPQSHTRLTRWKSFSPKASGIVFSVPLSLDWEEDTKTLLVGDDQGNVSLWDMSDVIDSYKLVVTPYPTTAAELIALQSSRIAPLSVLPRLKGFFAAHSKAVSVRTVHWLPTYQLIMTATDTTVNFWSRTGRNISSLQQGRGTASGAGLEPYDLNWNEDNLYEDEDEDSSAGAGGGKGGFSLSRSFSFSQSMLGARRKSNLHMMLSAAPTHRTEMQASKKLLKRSLNSFVAVDKELYRNCFPFTNEDKLHWWVGEADEIPEDDETARLLRSAFGMTADARLVITPSTSPAVLRHRANRMKCSIRGARSGQLAHRKEKPTAVPKLADSPSSAGSPTSPIGPSHSFGFPSSVPGSFPSGGRGGDSDRKESDSDILSPPPLQKTLSASESMARFSDEGWVDEEEEEPPHDQFVSPQTVEAVLVTQLGPMLRDTASQRRVVLFNRGPVEVFNQPSLSSLYSTAELSYQMDWKAIETVKAGRIAAAQEERTQPRRSSLNETMLGKTVTSLTPPQRRSPAAEGSEGEGEGEREEEAKVYESWIHKEVDQFPEGGAMWTFRLPKASAAVSKSEKEALKRFNVNLSIVSLGSDRSNTPSTGGGGGPFFEEPFRPHGEPSPLMIGELSPLSPPFAAQRRTSIDELDKTANSTQSMLGGTTNSLESRLSHLHLRRNRRQSEDRQRLTTVQILEAQERQQKEDQEKALAYVNSTMKRRGVGLVPRRAQFSKMGRSLDLELERNEICLAVRGKHERPEPTGRTDGRPPSSTPPTPSLLSTKRPTVGVLDTAERQGGEQQQQQQQQGGGQEEEGVSVVAQGQQPERSIPTPTGRLVVDMDDPTFSRMVHAGSLYRKTFSEAQEVSKQQSILSEIRGIPRSSFGRPLGIGRPVTSGLGASTPPPGTHHRSHAHHPQPALRASTPGPTILLSSDADTKELNREQRTSKVRAALEQKTTGRQPGGTHWSASSRISVPYEHRNRSDERQKETHSHLHSTGSSPSRPRAATAGMTSVQTESSKARTPVPMGFENRRDYLQFMLHLPEKRRKQTAENATEFFQEQFTKV